MHTSKSLVIGFAALAIGLLALSHFLLSDRMDSVLSQVQALDRRMQATAATEQFIRGDGVYDTKRLFCSKEGGVVCRLTQLQLYPNLGSHPPLRVLLDALLETGKTKLGPEQRGRFNRIIADIYSSSNKFGGTDLAQSESPSDTADANTMYRGLLARAAVCWQSLDLCRGELPSETEDAIRRTVEFLQQHGKQAAPYEMSVRAEAIALAAQTVELKR